MKKVIEFSKGKKTYAIAFAVAVVAFAQALGWIDMSVAAQVYAFLGAGGIASLRASVSDLNS